MVRNTKIAMMGGGVLAGAAALALAAEALLWSSVHAPPRVPDSYGTSLSSSWMIRAAGGGEDAVRRASFPGDPDPAWGRDRGSPGDDARAGPAGPAGR